jgi:hypothetical protein
VARQGDAVAGGVHADGAATGEGAVVSGGFWTRLSHCGTRIDAGGGANKILEKWRGKCYLSEVAEKNFMRLKQEQVSGCRKHKACLAFSLFEVLIAFVIVAATFGTIVGGYVSGATKAQWSGYSLAAQTVSVHVLEQARAATWDTAGNNVQIMSLSMNNKATNYPGTPGTWNITGYTTNILDVPWNSTNYVVVTNFITISQLFVNNVTNPFIQLQMVRVDTVWPFAGWGRFARGTYTNTVCTLIAPDNRDPSTLGVSSSP